ncbi:unnamed protein product, partial [Ceratitis capitata]
MKGEKNSEEISSLYVVARYTCRGINITGKRGVSESFSRMKFFLSSQLDDEIRRCVQRRGKRFKDYVVVYKVLRDTQSTRAKKSETVYIKFPVESIKRREFRSLDE